MSTPPACLHFFVGRRRRRSDYLDVARHWYYGGSNHTHTLTYTSLYCSAALCTFENVQASVQPFLTMLRVFIKLYVLRQRYLAYHRLAIRYNRSRSQREKQKTRTRTRSNTFSFCNAQKSSSVVAEHELLGPVPAGFSKVKVKTN